MSVAGVPLASYGRQSKVATEVTKGLKPEYDVVHCCVDLDSAKRELPLLFKGDLSALPESRVGSNVGRPEAQRRVPRAVLCGGGIPKKEYEDLQRSVHEALGHEITWFKLYPEDQEKLLPEGSGPVTGPIPELIIKAWRVKMAGFQ